MHFSKFHDESPLKKQFSIRKIPRKSNLFGKVYKIYAKSLIMGENAITKLNI